MGFKLTAPRVARWLDAKAEKALAYYAEHEGEPISEPMLSFERWLRFHREDANCIERPDKNNIIRLTQMGRDVLQHLRIQKAAANGDTNG